MPPSRLWACLAVSAAASVLLASCSSSAAPPTAGHGSGPVDVLYAGSLVNLMEDHIGPAFDAATGYSFSGTSAGSTELASEIRGKLVQGDVFVSAAASADTSLTGAGNGSWVSWYATFADTELMIGYNPHSRFAGQFRTKPWYQVITEPGILVGRTDPATDPKGVLTVEALDDAARIEHLPALKALTHSTAEVFPEQTLVGELQSGQLDAGFFYAIEAKDAGIPTVALTPVHLSADYTITVLDKAPHPNGALSFVEYLLGSKGRSIMNSQGLVTIEPAPVTGHGAPASLDPLLKRS